MQRVAFFVDGSNLFGSLKSMNVEVEDYEQFYGYVYKESISAWQSATHLFSNVPIQLRRVYWYVVGAIDQWDLSLHQAQTALRKGFEQDREVKGQWLQSKRQILHSTAMPLQTKLGQSALPTSSFGTKVNAMPLRA